MDDRLWMGECLLYGKVSEGKVYYIANIPRGNVYVVNIRGKVCYAEGLLYDTGTEYTLCIKGIVRNLDMCPL